MAILQKGKDWYIDYYYQGRRKREKIGPSRRLAEAVLAKRKLEIAENRYLDVRRKNQVSFKELASLYLEYSRANKRSWVRDRVSIKSLEREFGDFRIDQLKSLSIEQYKQKRLKEVTPATVNRELACLKHMLNKGIEWAKCAENPVRQVKLLRENNSRLRYLTVEEAQKLYRGSASHLKPIVMLALETGMRRSEIFSVKWDDIDFEQKLIFVRNTKNGESREVPVSNLVANRLKDLKFKSPFVFCNESGKPYCSVRKSFASALKKAGIENFRFHDLRHTFASHLVMQGADLVTVKELLGHKSLRMTLRYAHLSPGHRRDAIERLKFFDGHLYGHQQVLTDFASKLKS
jgi:integrase